MKFSKKEEKDLSYRSKENANNEGDHKAKILEDENGTPVLYVKSIEKHNGKSDPVTSIFLEVLAYRFANRFLPNQISAETNFFQNLDGELRISSSWINNYIPIYEAGFPYEQDGAFRVNINGESRILRGNFFQNLLLMRFIGLGDSIGKGANTGYVLNEDGSVTLAQIDFGGAFAFADYETYNPLNNLGLMMVQKLNKKYLKDAENDPEYITFIPLEMYNARVRNLISNDFQLEINFLGHFQENYHVRDLLFGYYTYQEIQENISLYEQFTEALFEILSISPYDIDMLIQENMPDSLEGENLQTLKENIFQGLLLRQAVLSQIYQEDYTYYCNAHLIEPRTFEPVEFLMNEYEVSSADRQFEGTMMSQLNFIERLTGNSCEELSLFSFAVNLFDSSSSDDDISEGEIFFGINFSLQYKALESCLDHLMEILEECIIIGIDSILFGEIFDNINLFGDFYQSNVFKQVGLYYPGKVCSDLFEC